MQSALLTTKLHIPQSRFQIVSRPRLIDKLNDGCHHKLILISAPAGFGKTTLVSEWIAGIGHSVGWLQLDEGDNDTNRFLTYLIAACQTGAPSVGEGILGELQSPQPLPAEAILTTLVNDIATLSDDLILVLDDYHLIDAEAVNNVLASLLDHLPAQMHLVIITREDPQLPLARMRGKGQLTELRAIDLRFTTDEATDFLNRVMALDLSTADIDALEDRTEGWITGLQLAAISMQGSSDAAGFIKSFTGSHRFVLDYLIEEVLEQQSAEIQDFLLKTAILYRMTGPLCDAVTGQTDSQTTLDMLERANLFVIPLDNERHWYRYHHLFADLLRQRQASMAFNHVNSLHAQASRWFEQHDLLDDAIRHALLSEDFERAAALIEQVIESVWGRGESAKLIRWLTGIPHDILVARPTLCLHFAWEMLGIGNLTQCVESLDIAEQAVSSYSDMASSPNDPSLLGKIATTRAFTAFYTGNYSAIIQHARFALDNLHERDIGWRSAAANLLGDAFDISGDIDASYHARLDALDITRRTGNVFQLLLSHVKLIVILRQKGQINHALDLCRQQMQIVKNNGMTQTVVGGWLLAVWGELSAETNQLDHALEQATKGIKLLDHGGDVAMLSHSTICLIRIFFSRKEFDRAAEPVQDLEYISREQFVPPWIMHLSAAWLCRVWLAQSKWTLVEQWITERGLSVDDEITYQHEAEYVVYARVLIAHGKLDDAGMVLDRILEASEQGGRVAQIIEVLILQSFLWRDRGDSEQAMTQFERALTLGEAGGFLRIFLDEGDPVRQLLLEADDRDILPDYVHSLLDAFNPDMEMPPATRPDSRAEDVLVDPLSERELEVLELIAEGLTNQEVASRLYLSAHTVKVHTRNIYSKLDVHNRTEAVTTAIAIGMIADLS